MRNLLENLSPNARSWLFDLFWLGIFSVIFLGVGLGIYPLLVPDEGRYSEIAREMVATNDYITPRLNGIPFLDKPILYYWLQALSIQLFGLKEWALRFWPAFFGGLSSLLMYVAGRGLFNRRTGVFAALLMLTTPLYFLGAHYANMDIEVASLITAALLCFMLAQRKETKISRNLFLYTAYIFSGLAVLTKGLIGFVFPVIIIGLWILLLQRWRTIKEMHIIPGILIILMINTPWYLLVQNANPQFFDYFFLNQHFSRFLETGFNNPQPIWFYLPIVIGGFLPWVLFLVQTFTNSIRDIIANRLQHDMELFLIIWAVIVFVFFSLPASKLIGYILPVFPPLTLLVAQYLSRKLDEQKLLGLQIGSILYAVLSLVVASVLFALTRLGMFSTIKLPILGVYNYFGFIIFVLFASGIITAVALYRKKFKVIIYNMIASMFFILLAVISAMPNIPLHTTKPLATIINQFIKPNDIIATYNDYFQDLPLYTQRRIVIVSPWDTKNLMQKDNWQRPFAYGIAWQPNHDWLINEETFWQRWHSPQTIYVLVKAKRMQQFQLKAQRDFYVIGQYQGVWLITNKHYFAIMPELFFAPPRQQGK